MWLTELKCSHMTLHCHHHATHSWHWWSCQWIQTWQIKSIYSVSQFTRLIVNNQQILLKINLYQSCVISSGSASTRQSTTAEICEVSSFAGRNLRDPKQHTITPLFTTADKVLPNAHLYLSVLSQQRVETCAVAGRPILSHDVLLPSQP